MFRSLCLLSFIIYEIKLQSLDPKIKIEEVSSIALIPMPYQVTETYLLHMDNEQRRQLCEQMYLVVPLPVLPPKAKEIVVLGAHMYGFDNVGWLAIRCPSTPVMYVSYLYIDNRIHWYIHIITPPKVNHYKFILEAVPHVRDLNQAIVGGSRHKCFNTLKLEERWFICYEAQKLIRYEVTKRIESNDIEPPRFYKFEYTDDQWEINFGFRCLTEPAMYVYISDSDSCNLITIVLAGSEWIGKDFDATKNIEPLPTKSTSNISERII